MIVRGVIKDPSLLDNFDYFNDATDTIAWLRGLAATPCVNEIDDGAKADLRELATTLADIIAAEHKRRR